MKNLNKHIVLILLLCVTRGWCQNSLIAQTKFNDESYEKLRNELIANNQLESFASGVKLSDAELSLESKMRNARKTFLEKVNSEKYPLFNSSFHQIKPFIESTRLFGLLQRMPKGALLHSHNGGIADAKWVIAAAKKYKECYIYKQADNDQYIFGQLAFFSAGKVPVGFVNLQKHIAENPDFESKLYDLLILKRNSLCDYMDYWVEFEKRFTRTSLLLSYRPFFKEYYQEAFMELAKDNVQHLEIRFIPGNLFDFQKGEYPLKTTITDLKESLLETQKVYPYFTLKIIYTSFKFLDNNSIEKQMELALQLKQKYPDFIAGFDLVADEATGNSISYFRSGWAKLDSLSRKYAIELPLFLHAGESNSIFNKNLFDIPLLNNKRIGHALNLAYFPRVLKKIKEKDILVEISPISNQVLGYVSDLRNHPARVLLANGVQCSINSDDPGVFGYEGLSYDFWIATIAWELDLRELKKLVFNSIGYSSLQENEKRPAVQHLEKEWTKFVKEANDVLDGSKRKYL